MVSLCHWDTDTIPNEKNKAAFYRLPLSFCGYILSLTHALVCNKMCIRDRGTPYNEDGSITEFPIPGSSSDPNPLADEQDGVYKNNTKAGRAYVDAYLEWKPVKGLSCLLYTSRCV